MFHGSDENEISWKSKKLKILQMHFRSDDAMRRFFPDKDVGWKQKIL